LRAEITLNRLQLSVLDSEILHVPERFTVLGMAKILHKSMVRASRNPLQVKMSNEINLCVPALCFEPALADVVVAGRARKGKIIGEQAIERTQVLLFPCPYHLRMISSFVKFFPPNALALAGPGRLTAPTSAQAPVANRFLRDTAELVIAGSPFNVVSEHLSTPASRPTTPTPESKTPSQALDRR
jgi:hypothetical protein